MRALGPLCTTIAGLVWVLSGCAENDSGLYVEGVLSPRSPSCEYAADPNAAMLFRGVLDVAFRHKYEGVVLVANQLTPRGKKNELRTETSGLRIRGSEVVLTTSQGSVLDEFSVNGGGYIEASRSEAPGYGLAEVTLIPPNRGAALANDLEGKRGTIRTLIANVRVFGETLGRVEVTSADFTFPVDVCWGCLVEYPLEAVEPLSDGSLVCGGAAEGVTLQQCQPGQDERIDCRACAATSNVCYTL